MRDWYMGIHKSQAICLPVISRNERHNTCNPLPFKAGTIGDFVAVEKIQCLWKLQLLFLKDDLGQFYFFSSIPWTPDLSLHTFS